MKQERVQIFIDAGNFYHLVLKKLKLRELDFSFEEFTEFLTGSRKITSDGKRFYVGTVREKHDGHENTKAMENQTKLFSSLIKKGDWAIKTSKLRSRTETIVVDDRVVNYRKILSSGIKKVEYRRSREKGIDVKLAVDLMVGAIDDKYDTAIVISSDTDLVPAIDWIRKRKKKRVEYIGFSIPETKNHKATKPTKTMIYNSDVQRVLVESDIRKFVTKVVLFDADGVSLQKHKYFSEIYAKKKNIPIERMNAFFRSGKFSLCQKGKADLKEEVLPFLEDWKWHKSVKEFLQYWFSSDVKEDEKILAEADRLRQKGKKCYLATDQEKYRAKYIKDSTSLGEHFDGLFFSYDLGCTKNEECFFQKILTKLGVKPEEVMYWDDDEENIEVAKKLGIDARFYSGYNDFVEQMKKI